MPNQDGYDGVGGSYLMNEQGERVRVNDVVETPEPEPITPPKKTSKKGVTDDAESR